MRHLHLPRLVVTLMVAFATLAITSLPMARLFAQDEAAAEVTEVAGDEAAASGTVDEAAHGDEHGAGHHGPTPSTAHAGAEMNSLLEFQSQKAVWSIVVFLLMLAGLYMVAWKPISEALEKRERMIANNISDAKNASEQAMAKLKEYEAKLASAAGEATDILSQARKDAESAGQRIIAEAQGEAARQRDRALADIESAKQNALSEMTAKSTDLAFSLARNVVGRELKTSDHQQLIQDALNKLPSRN